MSGPDVQPVCVWCLAGDCHLCVARWGDVRWCECACKWLTRKETR